MPQEIEAGSEQELEKNLELAAKTKERDLSPDDEFVITSIWGLVGRMKKAELLVDFKVDEEIILRVANELRDDFLKEKPDALFIDYLEDFFNDAFTHDQHSDYKKFFTFLISEVRAFSNSYSKGFGDAFFERTGRSLDDEIYLDTLTKIDNRKSFERDIDNLIRDRREDSPNFTLIMFDVDDFKDFNDKLGHLGGDRALSTLSQVVAKMLRGEDKIYRVGGDEFIILAKGDKQGIISLVHRVLNTVREISIDGVDMSISMGGVFSEDMEDRENWNRDKFIEIADKALYRAKEKGKDQFSE